LLFNLAAGRYRMFVRVAKMGVFALACGRRVENQCNVIDLSFPVRHVVLVQRIPQVRQAGEEMVVDSADPRGVSGGRHNLVHYQLRPRVGALSVTVIHAFAVPWSDDILETGEASKSAGPARLK
jgi:hypothetical protein